MTKLSELVTLLYRCHLALGEDAHSDDATLPEAIAAHLKGEKEGMKAIVELARVRGLLQQWRNYEPSPRQRFYNFLRERDAWKESDRNLEYGELILKCIEAALSQTTIPQSSSLVSQGAESADLGKLDTAPYSGHLGGKQPIQGSAETGGEKAAPKKCPDCAGHGYTCERVPIGGYGHHNVQCWTCKGTGKVALAESTLSSKKV